MNSAAGRKSARDVSAIFLCCGFLASLFGLLGSRTVVAAEMSSYAPGVGTVIFSDSPSRLTVALPVDFVVAAIRKAILDSPHDEKIHLRDANGTHFSNFSPNGTSWQLEIGVNGTAYTDLGSTDFDCRARYVFYVPFTRISTDPFRFDRLGLPYCHVSNDIFRAIVERQVNDELNRALPINGAGRFLGKETYDEITANPVLAPFLADGKVWGQYCYDKQMRNSICISLGWRNTYEHVFKEYIENLVLSAPESAEPGETKGFVVRRNELRKTSPRREVGSSGYKYPAGAHDFGDMAIFGGLLCASGEGEGCVLARCAQGKTGQFWRSPEHRDEPPRAGETPFSGDQFKGVVGYFLSAGSDRACPIGDRAGSTDPERFARFLDFVTNQRAPFPVPELPLDYGYRSCVEAANSVNCLLRGQEWYWLNLLAARYGQGDNVPFDMRQPEQTYGYKPEDLEVMAAFSPLGDDAYQTHLVGVEIYLLRKAGISSPALDRAAAILAARQPKNPFYLYLHLGNKKLVTDQLRQMCFGNVPADQRNEWAWQSDQRKNMWEKSMGWDCVFMFNNVLDSEEDKGKGGGPHTADSGECHSRRDGNRLRIDCSCRTEATDIGGGGKPCGRSLSVSADPGFYLDQGTEEIKTTESEGDRPNEGNCVRSYSDLVDIGDGIPPVARTMHLRVVAHSPAGSQNNGKVGKASCYLSVEQDSLNQK